MRNDLVLLFMRLAYGGMLLFGHGLPKLYAFAEKAATFPDPLGISPKASMGLAIFGEVFCSAAVMLGVLTRWAAIPPLVTMGVAIVFVHTADPWEKKELAVVYGVAFVCLVVAGGGRFTLDRLLRKERPA